MVRYMSKVIEGKHDMLLSTFIHNDKLWKIISEQDVEIKWEGEQIVLKARLTKIEKPVVYESNSIDIRRD